MKIYAKTEKGTIKAESEDRILIGGTVLAESSCCLELEDGCIAVADGVGGNNAGAVASEFVCRQLGKMEEVTEKELILLNQSLLEESQRSETYAGMATTLSAICFSANLPPRIFHVGNTRIYAIQAGRYLKQLTEDDTTVNYLVKRGKLDPEEAETYPAKNEITACMGGGDVGLFQPKTITLAAGEYSCFLLTSDGVHDHLSIDEMEDILGEADGDLEIAVAKLIGCAKERKSQDDCSVAVILHEQR